MSPSTSSDTAFGGPGKEALCGLDNTYVGNGTVGTVMMAVKRTGNNAYLNEVSATGNGPIIRLSCLPHVLGLWIDKEYKWM